MMALETGNGGASERIINRERSWLDFNARVLALAEDPHVPLLERVKFCAIFSSNLDEFFQVRVAALKDQVAAGITKTSPDGRTPAEQLLEISDHAQELVRVQEDLLLDRLVPTLAEAGIELHSWVDLDEDDRKHLVEVFEQRIYPVLTPLAVDPSHPFPYISNLSLNLAVMVTDPERGERRFARVKVPSSLPRFLPLRDGHRFTPLEEVIAAQLPTLFSGMELEEHWAFRVTRNADLTLEEEEADDLLAAVEMELRRRRFGRAVRLEVQEGMSAEVLGLLQRELDLGEDDVYFHRAPLDLKGLFLVHALDRPDLKDEQWPAVTPRRLALATDEERSIFSVVRERDVLMHHPYDSFATSTEEFIRQASEDPRVLTIKMTLYRTSGDSPIVRSLIRAAERGVQVAALVELKARFDEQANIAWAKALERAGVHVVYGLVGLKTHSKCVLVVREEGDGIRRYVHVGTGNYNSSTARLYEDLGVLSCDTDLGMDLTQLFNHLTGYSREVRYRKLLVAPSSMRHRFQDLILN
ncbi:MAG TPA: polyphosphate kinase 1, partial [Acidimicrobiales bacterium]